MKTKVCCTCKIKKDKSLFSSGNYFNPKDIPQ